MDWISLKVILCHVHFFFIFQIVGVYSRETKEVFDFISKLISQAKKKCKYIINIT